MCDFFLKRGASIDSPFFKPWIPWFPFPHSNYLHRRHGSWPLPFWHRASDCRSHSALCDSHRIHPPTRWWSVSVLEHRPWPHAGCAPCRWVWPRSRRRFGPICWVFPGCGPVLGRTKKRKRKWEICFENVRSFEGCPNLDSKCKIETTSSRKDHWNWIDCFRYLKREEWLETIEHDPTIRRTNLFSSSPPSIIEHHA